MTSSERRSLMAERGYSVVRLQVESNPYASARPNRRSALARNSANLAGRGTSSLLCMAIDGGATRIVDVGPPTSTIADTRRFIPNCRQPNAILQATSAFAYSKGRHLLHRFAGKDSFHRNVAVLSDPFILRSPGNRTRQKSQDRY